MASEASIANTMLVGLGEPTITSLDETSERALTIKVVYADALEFLLEQHVWNFAKARVRLAKVTQAPLFGYSVAFKLPADFLRLLDTDPELSEYRVENGCILCDETTLSINYIRRITDPNSMPPSFREALSYLIGTKVAKKLTGGDGAVDKMKAYFADSLRTAKNLNAVSGGVEDIERPDAFIQARRY